jgi:hypothetical protein
MGASASIPLKGLDREATQLVDLAVRGASGPAREKARK